MYQKFLDSYSGGVTTGEQVGEVIARLAGFYPNYNAAMVKAERSFSIVSRDEVLKTDEATGKPMSSSKAETIAEASPDANAFREAKSHVQNLEMLIQSLKALQRGLINEMINGGLN